MSDMKLDRLQGFSDYPGPLVFLVLDGLGIGKRDESDGVYLAYTPVLDALYQEPLYTQLQAHGTVVGLPSDDDMGNSEVGHNALGAGRVFPQGARLVNEAIEKGAIFEGEAWKKVAERAQAGGTVHFLGLLSDGNVHSHIAHLFAMLDKAKEQGFPRVRIHILADGRDVGEKSVLTYLDQLEQKLDALNQGGGDFAIASGGGRMVTTMDRYEADWDVVKNGWYAHVLGEGREFPSAREAIQTYYDEDPNITDQYLPSFVVTRDGKPAGTIEDGDAVIMYNFRGDRAIEISRAFEEDDFDKFDRKRQPDVYYAGMMEYDGDKHIPSHYLVEPPVIDHTIAEYMCAQKITQYAIAETQKFGHVTYFWNGNKTGYVCEDLEKYDEVTSDRVQFDQRPWMKAAEVTDKVIETIRGGEHKFIRVNYANGDMVGHTAIPIAVRIAVETVDLCLRRILPAVEKAGGVLVVTADHGNADCMWNEKKGKRDPMTAHTLNPVPFIVKDYSGKNAWKMNGGIEKPGLNNVAATLLALLGYQKPELYDDALVTL